MSWLSEIAHDPLKVSIAAVAVTLIVGLSASTVALIIGWRQGTSSRLAAQAAIKSADASLLTARISGHREVARLRMNWMESLRTTLAKYHSMLMTTGDDTPDGSSPISEEDARELSRLGTELDLLLNRSDTLQNELWLCSDKIYNLVTRDDRQALDLELMEKGRAVLKAEWEKVKAEMRGSEFRTGET